VQALARNGFTSDQVKQALHSSNRTISFRYELLDASNQYVRTLSGIQDASITQNTESEIQRTARFTLLDDGSVNFLSQRIKPYARLWIPPGRIFGRYNTFLSPQYPAEFEVQEKPITGGWVEFPLGVFLLSTPSRRARETGGVIREVEAYDQLQVLKDDRVTGRYLIVVGTPYIGAIKTLLDGAGIVSQNLTTSTKTLPVDREWDMGTPKLTIIGELLKALNYDPLFFDEEGVAIARPYVSSDQRASEYTYADDDKSVLFPDVEETVDLFNVPNQFVLTVSQPDRPALRSIYTNNNPASPTSTVSRGRTIVDPRQVDAVDQATLDSLAQTAAFKASQVYQTVSMGTGIMPQHSHNDVLSLQFSSLGINAKYEEIGWSMQLKAGARMEHTIRRVITV
jgi:hypothetical protein